MNRDFNLILILQRGDKIMSKFGRFEELDHISTAADDEIMLVRDHAQELINTMRHLPLRTIDSDFIARLFRAWEIDFAVVFLLEFIDFRKAGDKLTVVKSINVDNL